MWLPCTIIGQKSYSWNILNITTLFHQTVQKLRKRILSLADEDVIKAHRKRSTCIARGVRTTRDEENVATDCG